MKEKVDTGWKTWQVISPEKVFTNYFKQRFGSYKIAMVDTYGVL